MSDHQLVQLHVGLPLSPLTGPALTEFVAELEQVNALADDAPGFVWRLRSADGTASMIRPFGRDRMILNLSVWTSVEAFAGFVFEGNGRPQVIRRRQNWFRTVRLAEQLLWWTPPGERPTAADAEHRFTHLMENGPSPSAFTLRERFTAPAEA